MTTCHPSRQTVANKNAHRFGMNECCELSFESLPLNVYLRARIYSGRASSFPTPASALASTSSRTTSRWCATQAMGLTAPAQPAVRGSYSPGPTGTRAERIADLLDSSRRTQANKVHRALTSVFLCISGGTLTSSARSRTCLCWQRKKKGTSRTH